jgi:kexin
MTLKHWDENAVGQWELTVKDDEHDETTGRLIKWSLQLWGEVADEKDVRLWHPAAVGEVDEEETGSKTSQRPARPKPTDLLPSEHGGELPSSLVSATGIVPAPSSDADGQHPAADEGVFDGIDGLRKHSTWLAGAFLIVLLAALGGGAFFLIRQRNRRNRLMGLSGGGRGAYAPVADEEVGMSLLQRGRRAFGGRRGAEESKELYDAFGDGPSDSEDDEDREGLGYHDDFLHDEDEHSPLASGSGTRRSGDVGAGASGSRSKPRTPVLADHEDGDATPPRSQSPAAGQSNTSSSSWTDAADDARRD